MYSDKWYATLVERKRSSDWPGFLSEDDSLFRTIFTVAGAIYGGLHALAWNALFRTGTEHLLWRISASVVMAYGILFLLIVSFINLDGTPASSSTEQYHASRLLRDYYSRIGPMALPRVIFRPISSLGTVLKWLLFMLGGMGYIAFHAARE